MATLQTLYNESGTARVSKLPVHADSVKPENMAT